MSLTIKLTHHSISIPSSRPHSQGIHDSALLPGYFAKRSNTRLRHSLRRRPRLANSSDNTHELSDAGKHEGSSEREDTMKAESLTNNEILTKLKRYGVSGILSYGLLNTAYYLTTFLFVWLYVVPAPKRMGYLAAVERFLKVMAMVWAGSQVTKLIRAGGALALAPFVDRGLSWFTAKFRFESQGKAFVAIVAFCFGLAIVLFLVITLLWA
ncbi:hypothetical protein QN277_002006 [Acacia crassicarpa]|uniref:Gag-Pol polyprotein/retrotransposon n=1 Tax=Acacia crassicarpa TaxID=499986 RepID=A0AAE1N9P4_9FABA|nr:hypothetical protein QN277_002006 [Acacia crassicarpa]